MNLIVKEVEELFIFLFIFLVYSHSTSFTIISITLFPSLLTFIPLVWLFYPFKYLRSIQANPKWITPMIAISVKNGDKSAEDHVGPPMPGL